MLLVVHEPWTPVASGTPSQEYVLLDAAAARVETAAGSRADRLPTTWSRFVVAPAVVLDAPRAAGGEPRRDVGALVYVGLYARREGDDWLAGREACMERSWFIRIDTASGGWRVSGSTRPLPEDVAMATDVLVGAYIRDPPVGVFDLETARANPAARRRARRRR